MDPISQCFPDLVWNCVSYERKLLPYSLKYSGIWPFIEKNLYSREIMKKKQKTNRVWFEPLGGGSNWPISVCLSDFTRTSRFLFSIDLRIFISKVFHTRSLRINCKRDTKPEIKKPMNNSSLISLSHPQVDFEDDYITPFIRKLEDQRMVFSDNLRDVQRITKAFRLVELSEFYIYMLFLANN